LFVRGAGWGSGGRGVIARGSSRTVGQRL
jgi:hypothetical protein